MARQVKRHRGQTGKTKALPFVKVNYILFGIGIALIIFGYIALSKGPWDSFWSLTLAPILLVLGYCVVIPVAILYKKRSTMENKAHVQAEGTAQE